MARDQYGARIIFSGKEILGLGRQMILAPFAIDAVTAAREEQRHEAEHQTARPPPVKIPPLQGADVSETVVISGILHCDEELKRRPPDRTRERSKPG